MTAMSAAVGGALGFLLKLPASATSANERSVRPASAAAFRSSSVTSSHCTTDVRVAKAAAAPRLNSTSLRASTREPATTDRPVCCTMYDTASAPSVSYSGTMAAPYENAACCVVLHSHRFLP